MLANKNVLVKNMFFDCCDVEILLFLRTVYCRSLLYPFNDCLQI